jgi:hypothetical protein
MKQIFSLESFQKIFFLMFFLGIVIGALSGIYLFSPDKFKIYSIIPTIPAFYIITKGLYKNGKLFFMDLKSIKEQI